MNLTVLTSSAIGFSLLFSWSLLELHLTHMHDTSRALEGTDLLFFRKAKDVKGFLEHYNTANVNTPIPLLVCMNDISPRYIIQGAHFNILVLTSSVKPSTSKASLKR